MPYSTAFEPKKNFSQNFLINTDMQKKVSQAFGEFSKKFNFANIIEIGPGQGDLTQYLLEMEKPVFAIEIDLDAVVHLEERFFDYANFKVFFGDAREYLSETEKSNLIPFNSVLFSNLPYNLGSRILVDLPIYHPQMPFFVILQKEVVDKLRRTTSDFTFFGAWMNLFWEFKPQFDIAAGNFYPAPDVTSSCVAAKPYLNKSLYFYFSETKGRMRAKEILKLLFSNPSKTLANNLKYLGWEAEKIAQFYEENELDRTTRLGWDNYDMILLKILEVF
jgi:16S rRNA (adenine1518-N6/adenine1519-N6)-dimethyltransferase